MHQLAAQIKQKGRELGFDLIGIASAEGSTRREYFRQWLDQGQAGGMEWLSRRFEERVDPGVYFPAARSVICVAANYFVRNDEQEPMNGERGRVARYAWGEDYHEVIKGRLHHLADWIRVQAPEAQTRSAVDTAPVMEKELAARAGIGWLGKNTCIINEKIGSWVLLGEILTSLELPPDSPAIDRCGTCRRCIDACPTQAITAPYQLDARKCISYLNIEHRGELSSQQKSNLGEWLFGCDICQDVCPWNNDAPSTDDPAFQSRLPEGKIDLNDLLNWRSEEYAARLRGSAMKRVKLPILQRNARIVLTNQPAAKEPP